MTPATRRQVAGELRDEHAGWAERRICDALGWSRTSVRYSPSHSDDAARHARDRLKAVASERVAWGYRRLFRLWKAEFPRFGWRRFRSWYVELGLGHSRPRRRRVLPRPTRPSVPRSKGARSSYAIDFMHHVTCRGGSFRILVVVDEFTREILALRVARSFTSRDVTRVLADVVAEYGTPSVLRSDNGPEFISDTVRSWLRERGTAQQLSRPGKPCDNGLCESTNGRIRDELLRPNLFETIEAAADATAAYREDYNTIRPHSALDGLAPSIFHQQLTPPTLQSA